MLRTARNFRSAEIKALCVTVNTDKDMAIQSAKEECDINVIVRRFGLTKVLPDVPLPPTYADFTEAGDFRESMEAIRMAKESFMQLPADVRSKFRNDPGAFVDFCSDPENLDEMREMGLAVPKEAKREPQEVRIVGDDRVPSGGGDQK